MGLVMENSAEKNLVRRYLLGDLPEAEQLSLEQNYFTDSEKFEQVWDLENELVDGYVRDGLTKQERTLFERNYLTTPRHQQRVAVAKSLLSAADETIAEEKAISEAHETTSWWANLLAIFQLPQMALGAAAALLLLTLVGYWYFRGGGLSPEQIARNVPDVQPPATSQTPVPTPTSPPATTPSVAQATPAPQISPTAQPAVPAVLAFVLGGSLRKPGDVQPLTVPSGTKQVRLQMKLEGDDYSSYQFKLRSAGGREVLSQSALRPASNKKSVAVSIPANKLAPGDYILTLSGVTSANETEEVNRYFFRIISK